MDERVDVLVVGAGPAGAVAALSLARRGVRVRLVDRARFPRPKVCGGCLNGPAVAAVAALGIDPGGAPIDQLELRIGTGRADLAIPPGRAVDRASFDARLAAAAVAAGARFEDGAAAHLLAPARDGGNHRLRIGDREVGARVLVAAGGLGGRLLAEVPGFGARPAPASRMGAGAILAGDPAGLAARTILMHVHPRGYAGLVRLADDTTAVAAALDPAWVRELGGPAVAVERIVGRALPEADWRGTPLLTRGPTRVAGERLFVIGDAAGYVEPFTGEGMAWAIQAGLAVAAPATEAARNWRPALAERWEAEHRRRAARRHRGCRWLAALLRRPRLTRATVAALVVAPRVGTLVARRLGRMDAAHAEVAP